MAGLDVEQIIKDIYSGMDSPTARRARAQMSKEKSFAADDENYRKRKLFENTELAKQGMADTGALLRQRLTNEGNVSVANVNADAQRYGDDQKLTGDLYKANALRRASELENETSRLNTAATNRANMAIHVDPENYSKANAFVNPLSQKEYQSSEITSQPATQPAKPAAAPISQPSTPVRAAINNAAASTSKPYNPNAMDWGNMQQAPGYVKYQNNLTEKARKRKQNEFQAATAYNNQLKANNQNMINPANQAARRRLMGME